MLNVGSTCLLPHGCKLPYNYTQGRKEKGQEENGAVFLSSVSQKPPQKTTSGVSLARSERECCKGGGKVRVRWLEQVNLDLSPGPGYITT